MLPIFSASVGGAIRFPSIPWINAIGSLPLFPSKLSKVVKVCAAEVRAVAIQNTAQMEAGFKYDNFMGPSLFSDNELDSSVRTGMRTDFANAYTQRRRVVCENRVKTRG